MTGERKAFKTDYPFLIVCLLISFFNYFTEILWVKIIIWAIIIIVLIFHLLSVRLKNKKLGEASYLIADLFQV
jgi:hypothetical protein